eukprot:47502-Eustigmatos_ZCMA.PRE.1
MPFTHTRLCFLQREILYILRAALEYQVSYRPGWSREVALLLLFPVSTNHQISCPLQTLCLCVDVHPQAVSPLRSMSTLMTPFLTRSSLAPRSVSRAWPGPSRCSASRRPCPPQDTPSQQAATRPAGRPERSRIR